MFIRLFSTVSLATALVAVSACSHDSITSPAAAANSSAISGQNGTRSDTTGKSSGQGGARSDSTGRDDNGGARRDSTGTDDKGGARRDSTGTDDRGGAHSDSTGTDDKGGTRADSTGGDDKGGTRAGGDSTGSTGGQGGAQGGATNRVRMLATLAANGAVANAKGKAKYDAQGAQRELQIEVENLRPGTVVNFFVNGAAVGSSQTVDALGAARIDLSTQLGHSVPTIKAGDVVEVKTSAGAALVTGKF